MQIFERPLLNSERRWLSRLAGHKRAAGRRMTKAGFLVVPLLFGLLAALTLTVSNVDWRGVLAFWASLGAAIGLWTNLEERRRLARLDRNGNRALAVNKARVTRIQSSGVVVIEEQDDEGATYAFQLSGQEIVFVVGQEFCPSARFPNSDFDIIEIIGDLDAVVGTLIGKRGDRLVPLRTISPASAMTLRRPEHLQVISGSLADLEHGLANKAD